MTESLFETPPKLGPYRFPPTIDTDSEKETFLREVSRLARDLGYDEGWQSRLTLWLRQNAAQSSGYNAQTGTAYTLVITDRDKTVLMNNGSANTLTIPANSAVQFGIGVQIRVIQQGAGATTVTGDTGVTLNGVSGGSGALTAQYDDVRLIKVDTDEWIMSGQHGAVS